MAVKDALDDMGLHYKYIDLGEADLIENTITPVQHDHLKSVLQKSGLELMDETKSVLVERVKNIIVEMIHYADELPKHKIPEYLGKQLNHDYTYLSNLFKEVTGKTIQHYILLHKIEKAKELILYDELNLNEISYKLHYSGVAHLSNQFKKLTGLTPTYFKKIHNYKKRIMPVAI
jgi:YesN/AraC family two-component response regulator